MEQEIIHIPQLAQILGRSESSIRSAIQVGAYWLPPSFKQGTRICWRISSVKKFLQECEEGKHTPARPGRKRQQPPTLAKVS